MDDELQEIRDNFYAGNFQKALNLSQSSNQNLDDVAAGELGALAARCCLAIPIFDKLKAMQNSEIPGQKAAAFMAVIMKSKNEAQVSSAKEKLQNLAKETQDMGAAMLAAISLAADGSWTDAAQLTKAHPTLEMQALCVLFCLCCNQVNMAENLLKEMTGNNDDSAAFRLASAAVKLATGDPEEAYLTYCDLSTQFPPVDGDDSGGGSVLLQTGKALANMQRSMFSEAVEDLQRALQVAPNDADVLVNLCCCMTNLGRKEQFNEYYSTLEKVSPAHPYVLKTQGISQAFARFKANQQV